MPWSPRSGSSQGQPQGDARGYGYVGTPQQDRAAPMALAGLRAERTVAPGAGGDRADRLLPAQQPGHPRRPGAVPGTERDGQPQRHGGPERPDHPGPHGPCGRQHRPLRPHGRAGPGQPRPHAAGALRHHRRWRALQPAQPRRRGLLLLRRHAPGEAGPGQGRQPGVARFAHGGDEEPPAPGGQPLLQQLGQLQPHLPLVRDAEAVSPQHAHPRVQLLLPGGCGA